MACEGSITRCISLLKRGDRTAAQPLGDRYFQRLVELARARLRVAPRRLADEEDVALSAESALLHVYSCHEMKSGPGEACATK